MLNLVNEYAPLKTVSLHVRYTLAIFRSAIERFKKMLFRLREIVMHYGDQFCHKQGFMFL